MKPTSQRMAQHTRSVRPKQAMKCGPTASQITWSRVSFQQTNVTHAHTHLANAQACMAHADMHRLLFAPTIFVFTMHARAHMFCSSPVTLHQEVLASSAFFLQSPAVLRAAPNLLLADHFHDRPAHDHVTSNNSFASHLVPALPC